MADQTSGIDLMRRRMERASRQPPPPRRARPAPAPGAEATQEPPPAPPAPPEGVGDGAPAGRPPRPPRTARARPLAGAPAGPAPLRLAPDLPPVNLAIRVRKPLDDRLAELIHDLRRAGVRTSKVELVEMLLWELPEGRPEALRERLRAFRACAPRGAGAPLA